MRCGRLRAEPAVHRREDSTHDLTIATVDDWKVLREQRLDVIVDPLVYRIGQLFLEGVRAGGDEPDTRWRVIGQDLGALATFFDLLVMHERLAAFNYTDTFDMGLSFSDSLGGLVNRGDQKVLSIDVAYDAYMATKAAAVEQFRNRLADGPFITAPVAQQILSTITAVDYKWTPDLLGLQQELAPDQHQLARFLVGILVFAGYAQQSGASHVLSPRRSALTAAIGLRTWQGDATEASVFAEIARRVDDAGEGWVQRDVPWTPSFLPLLISRVDPYRVDPAVLVEEAKELSDTRAVRRYRDLRRRLLSEDEDQSADAREELERIADDLAGELGSSRRELGATHDVMVEVLPGAVGVVAPAVGGALVAGPVGALVGGLVGVVGAATLKPVQERLWGWVIDRLPFVSARKLLSRATREEFQARVDGKLASDLRAVWETTPRHS
jgi:hypothetical protein